MEYILNAFIAGILVLLPATVLSQEQETKFFLTTQPCAPVIQMTNTVMNNYGEKPLHSGRGMQRSSSDSKEYWSSMMFFVPSTLTLNISFSGRPKSVIAAE